MKKVLKYSTIKTIFKVSYEEELLQLDKLLAKYIMLPEYLCFVPGKRDPVYSRHALGRCQNISHTPLCSFLGAYVLKDCMELSLIGGYHNSKELYYNLIDNTYSPIYNIDINNDYSDVINSKLPTDSNGIPLVLFQPDDIVLIMNIITNLIDKFHLLIECDFDSVYEIDISKSIFIIHRHITIRDYRYSEYMEKRIC